MSGWGPFDLTAENAIVTGGALGIGRGIAARLCEAGANVLVSDIDEDAAAATARELDGHEGRAVSAHGDVTDPAAGEAMIAACVNAFGSVDILVNNAGVYPMETILEATPEHFDRVYEINVRGVALCTSAAAKRMVEQGNGGAIVNIASVDGFMPTMVGLAAYNASKGGVVVMTKNMALELGPHGIRVNAIAPGAIVTDGTRRIRHERGMNDEEIERSIEQVPPRLPAGRYGTPDDIGLAALFLTSPAASYIMGETLVVDGGFLLAH